MDCRQRHRRKVEENGLLLADYRDFLTARFDMYRLAGRGEARFVLDVQADLLDELGARIVI
ncbi:MAG: CcdB family protein [Acetobacter sp.]|jgi:hypothetical protein|nr:CcdB family protein [Acetobacter sp.]MCH4061073.1 CcdB family protein [Acetobacter sp.]MCH4088012.1 CcdB family protein [Acetobacter sp.]MCI1293374.1 CcdB family protein [Acetobacter sp.]MCI1320001.1 CcdB family protein [Acetobacter sp.]